MALRIIKHQPRPDATIRLFTFPYAGGSAAVFRPWNEHLPETIELCAVELPGRIQSPEDPTTDIHEMVSLILPDIQSMTDKPYHIYAHSFGSCVAFETVRALQKAHSPLPGNLIVSSRRAPHLPMRNEPTYHLSHDDFIDAMQRQYQAIPDVILQEKDLLERLLPILRADITINEEYRYESEEPLPIPISVFGGEEDSTVVQEDLMAWEKLTTKSFELDMFPGGHFFIDTLRADVINKIVNII